MILRVPMQVGMTGLRDLSDWLNLRPLSFTRVVLGQALQLQELRRKEVLA